MVTAQKLLWPKKITGEKCEMAEALRKNKWGNGRKS